MRALGRRAVRASHNDNERRRKGMTNRQRLAETRKALLVGAIQQVDGPYEHYMRSAILLALPDRYRRLASIVQYNDARGRKEEQVLAVVDQAITRAKEVFSWD
jgi:hypothetical protein